MILASVLLFAGCTKEQSIDSFDNIKLSKTYVSISDEGGSSQITVTATEAWAFDEKAIPTWLTIDNLSGAAGETVVTFSAEAISGGRDCELTIKAGNNTQHLRVCQGSKTAVNATAAEVNAAPDGKSFRIKGKCTSIANFDYGNWYLEDETGTVYIYGTLDANGGTKNFKSLNLEVGDIVEIEGPKGSYKDAPQMVNVTVLSIEKALLQITTPQPTVKAEGDEISVEVLYKGKGVFPSVAADAQDWISISSTETKLGIPSKTEPNPVDTAIVKIKVAAFEEFVPKREGTVIFSSSMKDDKNTVISTETSFTITQTGLVVPTIAEVRASTKGDKVNTEGTVMAIHQKGYIISDATGSIYVYTNAVPEVAVGNKIKISGEFDNYYGTLQIKNATVSSNDGATSVTYPTPIDLTDPAKYEEFATFSATNPTEFAYVKIKGVLSGNYNNIVTVGTSKKTAQFDYSSGDYAALNGKTVVVKAYIKGFHSNGYYQLMEVSVVEEGLEPEEPTIMTLTNAEICAAMTSSETSYVEYTIESASGTWTVNASQNNANTFLQCRGRKGSYIKTPAFDQDIKSVTLHFSEAKSVYADNVYCVFPSTWTAPTEDAAYPEDGNVGKATTDGSSSLTIPVNAGNKQVYISIIGTYSYYLDHIDVAF